MDLDSAAAGAAIGVASVALLGALLILSAFAFGLQSKSKLPSAFVDSTLQSIHLLSDALKY
jgi:hypothetical protein